MSFGLSLALVASVTVIKTFGQCTPTVLESLDRLIRLLIRLPSSAYCLLKTVCLECLDFGRLITQVTLQ